VVLLHNFVKVSVSELRLYLDGLDCVLFVDLDSGFFNCKISLMLGITVILICLIFLFV